MKCTVVIRTLNEAPRLRLTLASLARQTVAPEVIVVNDGSTDETATVIASFADRLDLAAIHHHAPLGRSVASNAGAEAASGDIVLFLDGDTLLHPEGVAQHLAAHAATPGLLGRGDTWHLRCTRFLLDPETASPRPGEEDRLARMRPEEREKLKVTRRQIEEDFASIDRRAAPGIYPGAGPRRLYELEIDALVNHPDCPVLWAASSGANFSVVRGDFLAIGGFDADVTNNEHRAMALRLAEAGGRMGFVAGARSYHLTHRSGWRDPLREGDWETVFFRRHPLLAVKLLAVFWAGIDDRSVIPPEARIETLPDLARFAQGDSGIDFDAVRARVPGLARLGPHRVPDRDRAA